MKTETITTIKLIASEGMTLTDGEHFGKEIFLGTGDSADNWHEIPDAEAKEMQNAILPEADEGITDNNYKEDV